MVRTLGVHYASPALYLAVIEQGVVLDEEPLRVPVPEHLETTKSVMRLRDDIGRRLDEARVDRGAILMPGAGYAGGDKAVVGHAGAETLLRLAAGDRGIDIVLLARSKARSALGLPRSGQTKDLIDDVVGPTVGAYWAQRKFAAFAGLARERTP